MNNLNCALISEHISQIKVYVRFFFPNCLDFRLKRKNFGRTDGASTACSLWTWRMQPFGWLKRGLQTAFPEAGHNREWIYVRRDGIRLWLKVSCCIVKGISPPVVSEHSKVCRWKKVERPEENSEKKNWMWNKYNRFSDLQNMQSTNP